MPRRRNSLVAAFSIRRAQAARSAREQMHPMLPLDLPNLDRALNGGLPLNRVTEIVGQGAGKTLLAAHAIASLQRRVPNAHAVWLDFAGDLDHDRLTTAGVDDTRLRVTQPSAATTLSDIRASLDDTVHIIVMSGLPRYRRGDHLYAAVLQQIAMTAPWTRAVLLILSEPGGDKSPLDRLAAVRLSLSYEQEPARADHAGPVYTATATVIKNRFGHGAIAVPLTIPLK